MNIKASDIMSDHVVVIHADMLIAQVAHLMLRDRVSSFPVVDGSGEIVGIITMTDLFLVIHKAYQNSPSENFETHISRFKDRKVTDLMSRHVITIKSDTSMNEIIHWVVENGIHCFPVMDDKKIVGIVSRHDILNAIFSFAAST